MSSKQGIINAKIRDAKKIKLICSNCKKEFEITYGIYRRYKDKTNIRCRHCSAKLWYSELSEDKKHIHDSKISQAWVNKSIEEKNKIIELKKLIWKNKSDIEKEQHRQTSSKNIKKYWNSLSPELYNEKINKSYNNLKKYRLTRSDEEKKRISKLISDSSKRFWKNISVEKYRELQQKRSINTKKWWDSISQEKKQAMANHLSKVAKQWWENLSNDEYEQWDLHRIQGCIKYHNKLKLFPNKNELSFIKYLDNLNILYIWHWYSTLKHKDFDKLFPINPITHSKVSYFKEWDFKIILKNKSILVDVDGSIHDYQRLNSLTSNKYNSKMLMAEYIKFNDSKRIYQTDGMDAYIILVYNDNLSESTIVQNILTNEIMNFKDFLIKIETNNL